MNVKSILLVLILICVPAFTQGQQKFTLTVQRNMTCNDGATIGRLLVDETEIARTHEPSASTRVAAGTYAATIRADGTKGWRIELAGTGNIQIHVGNYPSDTKGCILPGTDVKTATDPKTMTETCAVTGSKDAMASIAKAMAKAAGTKVTSEPLKISVEVKD